MPNVALVFPGQGSQAVAMGRALADAAPDAAAVFAEADAVLGEPLSRLAFEGPAEDLDQTVNAQPAILAVSMAMLAALRAAWAAIDAGAPIRPMLVAGHSMGQYSALVAAGSLGFGDALRLVRERGRLMQSSSEGTGAMGAVIGLGDAEIAQAIAIGASFGEVSVANRNAPGQVVLSGERPAVEAALDQAKLLGARRVIVLPVSVAAHSPLMADAAAGMRLVLEDVDFQAPEPPVLANADGAHLESAIAARTELVSHLTTGVDWVRVVERMAASGVDTFLEVGPGRVLTGLIKRIVPDATAIAVDAPSEGGIAHAAIQLAASAGVPAGAES